MKDHYVYSNRSRSKRNPSETPRTLEAILLNVSELEAERWRRDFERANQTASLKTRVESR